MATAKRKLEFSASNSLNIEQKSPKMHLTDCKEWNIDDVARFLRQNNLGEVVEAFKVNKVQGRNLEDLSDDNLKDMEINAFGTRSDILQVFRSLRGYPSPFVKELHLFKVFNDPIHGHIELHPLCVSIIDTPQFQRLRHILQLGGCYYVFPGATNKRFEHSIGVSHLAGQLVRILQARQPELCITEQDILCVEIAGLCHDLGHGPFSHMFDGNFIPRARPDFSWRHEVASADMFDHLIQDNKLEAEFKKYGLESRDFDFIREQITGPKDKEYLGRGVEKRFLYEIVANKRNGIDVDKWDYFARDCHSLGIKNNFDHQRFMKFVRVIEHEGEKQICSRDKEVHNVYDMFYTRSALHKRAYQHRVSNIIEEMITEALLAADDYIEIKGQNGKSYKMSTCVDDMEAYTKLTDNILHHIKFSEDPRLAEAKSLLDRIDRRQLYPFVGMGKPTHPRTLKEDVLPSLKQEIAKGYDLDPSDIILDVVRIDYGMKEKNPLDKVLFYNKNSPNKAYTMTKEDIPVSDLLPTQFSDQCLRMYVREKSKLEAAEKAFDAYCQRTKMIKQMSFDQIEGNVSMCASANTQLSGDGTPHPTSHSSDYFRTPE